MSNLSDSKTSTFNPNADASDPNYKERVAVPVMKAVDSMPPAYRVLVHEYGYVDIYRAWRRGMSPEQIRRRVRDGIFIL